MGSDGSACVGGLNPSSVVQSVKLDAQGNLLVSASAGGGTSSTSGTATISTVVASASTAVILNANTSRKGMILYNDSASAMYLAYAATASTSAFTFKIPANSGFEMPGPTYTGTLSAIWDSTTGNARITELT
jgi:hypothetical protein